MEKFWFNHYPSGIPHTIDPDAYTSLVDLFEKSCVTYQEKPAYYHLGHTVSYREIERLTRDFAAYLQNGLRLKKGTRIGLMMPNVFQYPIALFGALRAGLIVTNLNPLYTATEVAFQLRDAGAEVVLVLENFAHTLQAALPETHVEHVLVTRMGDLFPWPKSFVINFTLKYLKRLIPPWQIPHATDFKQALQQGRSLAFESVKLIGSDLAFLQYTGGTTGGSKGAMLTHRNMIANEEQINVWMSQVMNAGEEVIITALPMYHIFCLQVNLISFIEIGAMNVLITNPRDIPGLIKQLAKVPFSTLTGVNTLFNALMNDEHFQQLDFSTLKIAIGGGMAVQNAVADRWQALTGKRLYEGYGLTETSPVVTVDPFNETARQGSIGLPVPSTDLLIVDDKDQEVSVGECGELCVSGPQVMQGYWNREADNHAVFLREGWLRTGDIARIDSGGFVYLVDRKKDVIIVSGFNVYPNEIEDVIAKMEGIVEVAVVGEPSDRSGEAVKAHCVVNDPGLTAEQIRSFCKQHLTSYKIPTTVEFWDELPKSNIGKILRRSLRGK